MGSGFTRNSIIGKASRLGLSAKIKTRPRNSRNSVDVLPSNNNLKKGSRKNKFKSLLKEATSKPYAFLFLDLYGKPAKAYQNFTNLIYEAPETLANVAVNTDFDGFDPDDDEDRYEGTSE